MNAIMVAGLTGIHLTVLAILTVSILACIVVATRRQPEPDPALKAAVDAHWKPTAKGRRWSGADFKRPTANTHPKGDPK